LRLVLVDNFYFIVSNRYAVYIVLQSAN